MKQQLERIEKDLTNINLRRYQDNEELKSRIDKLEKDVAYLLQFAPIKKV